MRAWRPQKSGRVDLPPQAPRALEEAELRRVLRGATSALPHGQPSVTPAVAA